MKKNLIYLAAISSVLVAAACKKNDTVAATPAATTFTINGNVYTESGSNYVLNAATATLGAFATLAVAGQGTDGKAKGGLIFYFPGTSKPAAGTYTVVTDVSKATGNQVGIVAQDSVNVAQQGLYSSVAGSTATVTVSSAGKLTIAMPNTSFTGSNFNNTNPKNTVITTVTVSASGTAVEN